MTDRFFVYGTLAPGRPNEHVLADIEGRWEPGYVRGHLREEGWGATLGYPGIVLDEDGPEVHGVLFTSKALSGHWDRLDAFEGDGYERVHTTVRLEAGESVQAQIYVVSDAVQIPDHM